MNLKKATVVSLLSLSLLAPSRARAQADGPVLLEGRYESGAEGFAVVVPDNLVAITGNEAGPQRGITVLLPSNAIITVWGDPNSLEYRTPEAGVRDSLGKEASTCAKAVRVKPTKLGSMPAAQGTFSCGDRTLVLVLAFRPGGGPNYWLRLDSLESNREEDLKVLEQLKRSFALVEWN